METKLLLLNHFKVMHSSLEAISGSASLDMKTFVLSVNREGHNSNFYPQFLVFREGKKLYTPTLSPDTKVFIGWLPYFNKRWDISNEKLKFKDYCSANGVPVPQYSVSSDANMKNVLVKSNVSSFAYGIRGPFASSANFELTSGQFYESFKPGKILKIWYWNGKLVCVESQNMPAIVGNGKNTLREILTTRLKRLGRQADLDELSEFLAFKGKNLDSVIPDKERLVIDFRYGSKYYIPRFVNTWEAENEGLEDIRTQLVDIGEKLWMGIPETIRQNTLFTVDAIKGVNGKVWCLEMNSNPFVHPLAYPHMLDTLLVNARSSEDNVSPSRIAPGQPLFH